MCDRPPHPVTGDVADPPSLWVQRWRAAAPPGCALDLACGRGRHTRWLLDQGMAVVALDRDLSGLADLAAHPRLERIAADLEEADGAWPLEDRRFALVVVTRYLWRPILARLFDAVAPGGVLIYETFAVGQEQFGRPRNPDFLLRPGELRARADALGYEILGFEDGVDQDPRPARLQKLAARRLVA